MASRCPGIIDVGDRTARRAGKAVPASSLTLTVYTRYGYT